jgi:murein DD-endopeptidase MepM/ murein hydrolase activator NlpD
MLFRRHFTIMVLPDAQAFLRRFHVKGGQIAGGLVGLLTLVTLALVSPLLLLWSLQLSRELRQVKSDREHLAARSQEVEQTVAELRQKLASYEKRYDRLAAMAGLPVSSPQPGGQGRIVDAPLSAGAKFDLAKTETEQLTDRTALLERRIDGVEQAWGDQTERWSRFPALMPTQGLIGAGFGWRRDPFTGLNQFHRGVDILAPIGAPVRAPADGVVIHAGRDSGYGNTLVISHGDGVTTRYGHLSMFKVRPGQKVRRGDVVALVGNTGRSTGSHVHYEILENGAAVNPEKYWGDDAYF